MPVRMKDDVVHRVQNHALPDYHGMTVCGRVYAPKRKGDTWTHHEAHVWRAVASSAAVTCLACVVDARLVYPGDHVW